MKMSLCAAAALLAGVVMATGVNTPVAPGFVDWRNVTDANHLAGRRICASDLRGKAVMIVEFNAEKFGEAFTVLSRLSSRPMFKAFSITWMDYELPSDCIVVLVNTGRKMNAVEFAATVRTLKYADFQQSFDIYYQSFPPVYNAVTFPGAPSAGGAPVFAYVVGPDGPEVLWKGAVTEKTDKSAKDAFITAASKSPGWKPYFGTLERDDIPADVLKAYTTGKPLDKCYPKLIAAIKGHDEEKAKSAQLVYDALERTRSDLECRIACELDKSPASAFADVDELVRYWPSARRNIAVFEKQLKRNKAADVLGKALVKVRKYGADDFRCRNEGEVKKLQAELAKLGTGVNKFLDSKDVAVQGDASLVSSKLDSVSSGLAFKVGGE